MLYKDLEDCEQCPLNGSFCAGGYTSNGRGEPIEPPCCSFNDNDDLDDLYDKFCESERRYEAAMKAKYKKEQERIKRNEEMTKRRREANWHVRSEVSEIKRLKKRLSSNEAAVRFASSLSEALNFANSIMNSDNSKIENKPDPFEAENNSIKERIRDLEAIKANKLKELRDSRKASKK